MLGKQLWMPFHMEHQTRTELIIIALEPLTFSTGIPNKLLLATETPGNDAPLRSNSKLLWILDDANTGIHVSGWRFFPVKGHTEPPVYSNSRSGKIADNWLVKSKPGLLICCVSFSYSTRDYCFQIKYPHTLQICTCFLASRKQALPSSLLPLLPSPSPRYCLVRHKENSKERF